ncbi:MAG: DUF2723 domain-containing protein [Chloroflexota bacterium]
MSGTSGESPPPDLGRGGILAPADRARRSWPRSDAALAVAVGLSAFCVYLTTLSRGVLGGDAGELQFVPPILGLTHPTGYPLQVLVHYLWSLLPIGGSVAYSLNVLDAAFAAAAVGLVVAVTRLVGAGRAAAALAGWCLAFSELWWSQAVRGDKYTLNGLFLALTLLLFVRWRQRPTRTRFLFLAFVFGLSLTHHRSMLLAAPALGLGLLLFGWRPRAAREIVAPLLLVLAPLLLYLYVPWAGARGLPPGSWPVNTPAAFAEFLMDRGYTSQIRPDAAFGGRLVEEAWVLVRSFGPLGALLGAVGVVALFKRDWRLAVVLLLVFLPNAVLGASYLLESHYALPRHWVFFLPAFLVWSVWLGLGVDAALRRLASCHRSEPLTPSSAHRRGGRGVRALPPSIALCLVIVALLAVQAGSAWVRGAILLVRAEAGAETMDDWRQDLQRSPVAERFGRLAFQSAAENGIIVCDWEQATVLWYLQRVEGQRPDLTIRYPIERLDETLTEARGTRRPVYLSRTLPGVESIGVTSSAGPLIQVSSSPPPVAPATTQPGASSVAARFEGGLTLQAIAIHDPPLRPGGVVAFTLTWRAERQLAEAYAVSVRLIGPNGAVLAAQDERHPALGTSPTDRWPPGQIVGDYHEQPLGSRLAPGSYQILVLPYRVEPLTNLRRLDANGQPGEEGVAFPIQIEPRSFGRPLDLLAALLAR